MRERDRRRLKKRWGKASAAEIAAELGVSSRAASREARRLGLVDEEPRPGVEPRRRYLGPALVLLALLVYANNLGNGFVYDDEPAVTNNPAAHGLAQTKTIWTTPSWWAAAEGAKHYRPLTTFSFALNHSLHELRPRGYHLTNNLLHGLTSWLVLEVLLLAGLPLWPAALAAALFVVHPVHTESVDWVNGRADILAALFLLLTIYGHGRARRDGSVGWELLGWCAALLSGLAKETGYVAPLVVPLWDLLIRDRGDFRAWLARLRSREVAIYAAYGLVIGLFIWARLAFVGSLTGTTVTAMASPLGEANHLTLLLTGSYVIARYLWVLIWPVPLTVDYSPDAITAVTAATDPRAILGLLVVVAYLVAMRVAARRAPVLGFSLALAALVFAPASNLLFPIGTIMAERLMYLPVLAWIVPVAMGLSRLRISRPAVAVTLAVLLLGGYTVRTWLRAPDWRDELALFAAAHRVSPGSAMANKNLAAAYHNRGENEEAVRYARQALSILPEFPDAWYVLGNGLFMTGHPDGAVTAFRKTLDLAPQHASAHLNLGSALHVEGDLRGALDQFRIASELDPRLDLPWYNAVHTWVALGDVAHAKLVYDAAVERHPTSTARAGAAAKLREAGATGIR